jgi:hypothetical protein
MFAAPYLIAFANFLLAKWAIYAAWTAGVVRPRAPKAPDGHLCRKPGGKHPLGVTHLMAIYGVVTIYGRKAAHLMIIFAESRGKTPKGCHMPDDHLWCDDHLW